MQMLSVITKATFKEVVIRMSITHLQALHDQQPFNLSVHQGLYRKGNHDKQQQTPQARSNA
jgi:hypothetical protein